MWLLLLPCLIPVLTFSVYPLLNGIWLDFTDALAGYDVTFSFNGLENYVRLVQDDLFWSSFRISLIWAFGVTSIQFILALCLALLLNAGLRFQWLVRPLALVPWAMPSVIVAILWKLIYQRDAGLLSRLVIRVSSVITKSREVIDPGELKSDVPESVWKSVTVDGKIAGVTISAPTALSDKAVGMPGPEEELLISASPTVSNGRTASRRAPSQSAPLNPVEVGWCG